MKKRLRQFLHPLHIYVEKFLLLSATSNIRKAQHKQKKDLDRHHLSNSEILGDLILLRNNITTKQKTEMKESFHMYGLFLISFPKLHPKELESLKNETVRY